MLQCKRFYHDVRNMNPDLLSRAGADNLATMAEQNRSKKVDFDLNVLLIFTRCAR